MNKMSPLDEMIAHDLIDETEFLQTHSFDELVRRRARLRKSPAARRSKVAAPGRAKKGRPAKASKVRGAVAAKPNRAKAPYALTLLTKGEIEADLYRASLDYEQAYMAITGQLGFCVSKLEPKRDRSWPTMDEPTRRVIIQHAYNEWRGAVTAETRHVMEAIILNGEGIKRLEKRLGVGCGGVKKRFIEGLQKFARSRTLVVRRARHLSSQ